MTAKKPGKPGLNDLLVSWFEENKPSCPVGKLIASLGEEDQEAVERLLSAVATQNKRIKIPSKEAAKMVNAAFDVTVSSSGILSHNNEGCSCYGDA